MKTLCLVVAQFLAVDLLAADAPLLSDAKLVAPTSEELYRQTRRAEVLADRIVYWNDDGQAQCLAMFLYPTTNAKPAQVTLELADAKAVVASQKIDTGTNAWPKVRVLVNTDTLKVGEYELRAALLAADGTTITNAVPAKFSRANKSHTKVAIPKDGIPLIVHEQKVVDGASWPVTTGVPMPFGTLTDASTLQLLEDGKPVPSQWAVRAKWGPGESASIKWLGLDFEARYEGGKAKQYRIIQAKGAQPSAPSIKATQTDDSIEVDTGAIRFQVNRKQFRGIEAAWLGDQQVIAAPKLPAKDDKNAITPPPFGPYLTDGRGALYKAADDNTVEVRIEEQGPVRVTILARGWYSNPAMSDVAGKQLCQFVTRITAFAGQPTIRINHRTILAFDTRMNKLANVSFAVPVVGATNWLTSIDGVVTNGVLPKPGESVFLHQERSDRVRLMGDPKAKPLAEGKRADGWMAVASANATVSGTIRDVWQRFPKEFEADRDGLIFHFWPRHGRRVFTEEEELDPRNIYKVWFASQGRMLDLNMPREYYDKLQELHEKEGWDPEKTSDIGYMTTGEGVAIANEFEISFHKAQPKPDDLLAHARLFQQNPHAIASPEWNVGTLVEGSMAARDDARWPEIERFINEAYPTGVMNLAAFLGDYGMWIYGNTHNPLDNTQPRLHRVWQNSHYQHVGIPWFLYFRSGTPKLLEWARATADEYMSVGVVNYNNPDRPVKGRTAGAMFHAKGFMPWGSRQYGMYQFDADVGLTGHWVNPDAFLIRWLIEGDGRARDLYEIWSAALRTTRLPLGPGREASNTIGEIMNYYTTTWDPQGIQYMRDLAEAMLGTPFEKFPHSPSFPLWHKQWIDRYYSQVRDERVVQSIKGYIAAGYNTSAPNAFAYRQTGNIDYLRAMIPSVYDTSHMVYYNADDPLNYFGSYVTTYGPLDPYQLTYVLGAFKQAGINSIAPTPEDKSYYPVGSSHLYSQTGTNEIALTILALDPDDRDFKVTITPVESGMHPADFIVLSPSGKVVHVAEKLREQGKAVIVATIPKDGEKGVYSVLLFGHQPLFYAPFTDLPHEVAKLPKAVGVRSTNRQMGLLAVPPKSTVKLTFDAMGYGQIPQPGYVEVKDETGKILFQTSLLHIGKRNSASVELKSGDRVTTFPYYAFSWLGPSMRWEGDAEAFYLARNPKDLDAILRALAAVPKQNAPK